MPLKILPKIRQWDNSCARWMMRHFYFLFFQFVLAAIFFTFLFNTFRVIDLSASISANNLSEKMLFQQLVQSQIITLLILLNSFWMLFIFSGINRLRTLLRDINYNLMRWRK